MKKTLHSFRSLLKNFFRLIISSEFILVTVLGNSIVIFFATAFFLMENTLNPQVNIYLDALWWGFSTVTTVGYGDIIPATNAGKVLGIFLMLVGTGLFATYTALFARAVLGEDFFQLRRIESYEKRIAKNVRNLKSDINELEEKIEILGSKSS